MPSTLVHVGIAGLIGAALLDEHFDATSIAIVMGATALLDLDTFLGIWIEGGHRAILHNIWIPTLLTIGLYYDCRVRDESRIQAAYGNWGVRTAWVSIVALVFAHILLDAFYNGVNLFWPLHDQFYDLSGRLYYSDQEGFVQTFLTIDIINGRPTITPETAIGTTADTHYYTGVDPGPDHDPDVERIFPIADTGPLFVLMVTGYLTVAYKVWLE